MHLEASEFEPSSMGRVVGKLRGCRLTSELISSTVGSELTFYGVLDSSSTGEHGKKCPAKIFEVYVEILGVLSFGPNLAVTSGLEN